MDFMKYIINNYAMLYELIGLLVISLISAYLPQRIKVYGRITCLLLFLSVLTYNMELYTQTIGDAYIWRAILTATKYTLYPIVMITILPATSLKFHHSKKFILLLLLPELISIPFYYTSQWTHLIAYFGVSDGKSYYQGGVLSWWPYIIFGLYVAVFLVQNIVYFRNATKRIRFIPLFICILSIIAVITILISGEDVDYTPIFTSAYLLYFIFLYVYMASIDSLTGLMNRQCYYHDMRLYKDKITYVVSIDMNELKYINDAYGHYAGDEALISVSRMIKEHSGPQSTVYRVGGDEFIIFYYKQYSEEDIEAMIQNMNNALSKTSYSCAFGYAKKKDKESVDDTIKEADRWMYINKRQMKEMKHNKGDKVNKNTQQEQKDDSLE